MDYLALQNLLEKKDTLILDGAMGTALEQKGEALHPVLWSAGHLVSNPARIQEIHTDYLASGADILTTSSYQISYEGFEEHLCLDRRQTDELIRLSSQLALSAVGEDHKDKIVASSIGCYGAHLADGSEFFGSYGKSRQELLAWHAAKLPVHVASGAHALAFETVPSLEEVGALAQAVNDLPVNVQAWISLCCRSSSQLSHGETIEDACRAIEDADPFRKPSEALAQVEGDSDGRNVSRLAVGVNCTAPELVEDILQTFRDCCRKDRILLAYPNRGETWDAEKRCFDNSRPLDCRSFSDMAQRWKEAGARIIGGCCRTDANLIASLSSSFKGDQLLC
eukprot:gene6055-6669_t